MFSKIAQYIKQASTLRGVAILAGLLGWNIDPTMLNEIVTMVVGFLGLVEVVRDEEKDSLK